MEQEWNIISDWNSVETAIVNLRLELEEKGYRIHRVNRGDDHLFVRIYNGDKYVAEIEVNVFNG